MAMTLSFELTDRDLHYFRKMLQQSRDAVRDADIADILDAVRQTLDEIRNSVPLPDFVANRLPELDSLLQMLDDDEWQLPEIDREIALASFVYFADPEDILPDEIPVIGYLDDVIMIELVCGDLKHVRESYADFCAYREEFDEEHGADFDAVVRRDRLDKRRQQLQQRMSRRAASDRKRRLI